MTHSAPDALPDVDDPLVAEATLEPELDWSVLVPGRRFADVSFVASDAAVDAYLDATGEHHPAYSRDGDGLVPPLWPTLVRLVKRSLGGRWPSGTLQLDHRVSSRRALRRGERLTLATRIGRVEERNARAYFETVSTLHDAEGRVVGEQTSTSMWAGGSPAERTTEPAAAAATPGGHVIGAVEAAPATGADAPAGQATRPAPAFGPLSASYPIGMLRAFGRVAGALDPIHVDEAFARTTRFGSTIAQGRLVMTLVSRLMLERFGRSWLDGGEMAVRFVRPVRAGRGVSAWAAHDPAAPERWQVWCEDDTGQTVITGWARPGPPQTAGGPR
jgi:3-hydroxybutyryl-CoA dehydratase